MKNAGLILLMGALVAFSACEYVDRERVSGNGNITSKTYDYKNFSEIKASGAVHIYLKQDAAFNVKLETDENLISYVELQIQDGDELVVKTKKGINLRPSEGVKLYISAPSLDKVTASGASSLTTEGKYIQEKKIEFDLHGASEAEIAIRAPRVEMEASGASTFTIEGESRDIKADAQGASTINAFNLKAENAEAEASGASTIRIFSSVSLNADASGASTVKYKGNPRTNIKSTGASSVGKEN